MFLFEKGISQMSQCFIICTFHDYKMFNLMPMEHTNKIKINYYSLTNKEHSIIIDVSFLAYVVLSYHLQILHVR